MNPADALTKKLTTPTIEREVEVVDAESVFLSTLYFWSDGLVTWKPER